LQLPGSRVAGYIPEHDGIPPGLIDARIRVRGVCGALFNNDNQIVGVNLFVAGADKIQILEAAGPDPFAQVSWPIGKLQRFNLSGIPRHRLKVRGVVTAQFGSDFYVADSSGSVYVATKQSSQLKPGDRVEVVGFAGFQDYRPVVQDAVYRIEGSGPPVAPVVIDANQGVNDHYDSKLVTVRGVLYSMSATPEGKTFIIDHGGTVFSAILRTRRTQPFSLRAGSLLQLTGICLVDKDGMGAVQSFEVRLRSVQDVVVIDSPSWWTRGRALSVMGLMIAITCGVLIWLVILRRQVRVQTKGLLVKTIKLELANQTTQEALCRAQEAESLEVDRQHILQLVACDEPIERILDQLAAVAAVHSPGAVCVILLNFPEGRHVSSVPALPGDWQDVLKRIEISRISAGSESGGLSHFTSDPTWERLLKTHSTRRLRSFRACPILGSGQMSGAIVAFFEDQPLPNAQGDLLAGFARLAELALERRNLYNRLSFRAQYDLLTGLPNRPTFYERLAGEAARAVRSGTLLGVLYIDLDGFKEVNDIHGHAAGDSVLKEVAARMLQSVRRGDMAARIGGDEFAVLIPNLGAAEDAGRIIDKIVAALRQPIDVQGRELRMDASIGMSVCPADGEDPDSLLKIADAKMYRVKSAHQRSHVTGSDRARRTHQARYAIPDAIG
jgi:diguanylate cyclase (GGDEF)-like protein